MPNKVKFPMGRKLQNIGFEHEKAIKDLVNETKRIIKHNLHKFEKITVQRVGDEPGNLTELYRLNSGEPKYYADDSFEIYIEIASFLDKNDCGTIPIVRSLGFPMGLGGYKKELAMASLLCSICDFFTLKD